MRSVYSLQYSKKLLFLLHILFLIFSRHPNVVGYKEAFFEDATQSLCLVMDFADDGDLYEMITKNQKSNRLIEEHTIWSVLIETARALHVLHSKNVLHRDLKSANVFLQKNGSVKLGDMNVSKVAKKGLLYTQTGTPYYASPEVWRD
jgi:NIMA (never in mitosis gene a)-related kinase